MTNLHHRDNSGASISNFTYTYDAASRLTTEVLNGTTTTYTHDNTDQLTADGTNTFTYDANGNRNNGSYATGTGNQITSDGTWTYSYDAEGNMTKKSQGEEEETWFYGYDQQNQLIWAEKRAEDDQQSQLLTRADYKYDFKGNRIQKAVDSDGDTDIDTTERYAYDWWKTGPQTDFVGNENADIWADLNGSSSLTSRYLRGDVIDQIFARTDAGSNEAYWLLTDRLGSLRTVVDDTQAINDNIAYDGFGNVISESDAAFGGRYKWTGREVDVETELQYNRARYYDGKIGRWISQDPLGFEAGDSNLYRYVTNRPTANLDPSGLAFWQFDSPQVAVHLGSYDVIIRSNTSDVALFDQLDSTMVKANAPRDAINAIDNAYKKKTSPVDVVLIGHAGPGGSLTIGNMSLSAGALGVLQGKVNNLTIVGCAFAKGVGNIPQFAGLRPHEMILISKALSDEKCPASVIAWNYDMYMQGKWFFQFWKTPHVTTSIYAVRTVVRNGTLQW